MQLAIKKWGNSVGVRIPAAVLASMQLQADQLVELSVEDGKIIIAPLPQKNNLAQLLAQITPENLHQEISTGQAVGNEAL